MSFKLTVIYTFRKVDNENACNVVLSILLPFSTIRKKFLQKGKRSHKNEKFKFVLPIGVGRIIQKYTDEANETRPSRLTTFVPFPTIQYILFKKNFA